MFAIVEIGGKQYKVKEKDRIVVERLGPNDMDSAKVLLVADSGEPKIGMPLVSGAKVSLKLLSQGRADKVRIFKMKAKKRYRRTKGHKQPMSEVEVLKITV